MNKTNNDIRWMNVLTKFPKVCQNLAKDNLVEEL
jgi:hypothetical protein